MSIFLLHIPGQLGVDLPKIPPSYDPSISITYIPLLNNLILLYLFNLLRYLAIHIILRAAHEQAAETMMGWDRVRNVVRIEEVARGVCVDIGLSLAVLVGHGVLARQVLTLPLKDRIHFL